MATDNRPPFAGEWINEELGNTGQWSLGPVWLNPTVGGYCMQVGPQHCNALGVMHGGAMATFADAQMIADPDHSYDPARHTPTITLSVDYLAPAPEAAWILLTGRVLRRTRTLIFTEASVTIDDGLVARSNAIYRNHPDAGARS
jgi:acyl-coenzyme A thioesterase PaaI-like protein